MCFTYRIFSGVNGNTLFQYWRRGSNAGHRELCGFQYKFYDLCSFMTCFLWFPRVWQRKVKLFHFFPHYMKCINKERQENEFLKHPNSHCQLWLVKYLEDRISSLTVITENPSQTENWQLFWGPRENEVIQVNNVTSHGCCYRALQPGSASLQGCYWGI